MYHVEFLVISSIDDEKSKLSPKRWDIYPHNVEKINGIFKGKKGYQQSYPHYPQKFGWISWILFRVKINICFVKIG